MVLRIGILTVSDRSSRGIREDLSGPAIKKKILDQGWEVSCMEVVPDEFEPIQTVLCSWVDDQRLDVILTTGGTGFSIRDITPEATKAVIDRSAPGIAEAMRAASLAITPHAMLSRAMAGIRKQTLIINFPGSPKAATENMDIILPVLPHAVALLKDTPDSEAGHQYHHD